MCDCVLHSGQPVELVPHFRDELARAGVDEHFVDPTLVELAVAQVGALSPRQDIDETIAVHVHEHVVVTRIGLAEPGVVERGIGDVGEVQIAVVAQELDDAGSAAVLVKDR